MVDSLKIFSDVCLKDVAGEGEILACFSFEEIESPHRVKSPFSFPICIGIMDECFIKDWLKYADKGMMDNSVPKGGF